MNSRFLSPTHIHRAIVKSLAHPLSAFSFVSSPAANPHQFNSLSRTFRCKRYFHSSLMLKQEDSDENEKTFWQLYRASGEPKNKMLQTPDKMPYKKGQYITDHITKAEVERYMYPLFMRGWKIQAGMNDGPGPSITPYLASQIRFASTQKAEPIYAFLVALEKQEKHRILLNIEEGPQPLLSIRLHTHTARKMIDAIPGVEGYELTEPGITLRDVRYAVLLEQELLRSNSLFVPERRVEKNDKEIFDLLIGKEMEWDITMALYPWKLQDDDTPDITIHDVNL